MGVPRQEIGGAAIGDRIYVVGGVAPTSLAPSDVVEVYDTIADRWSLVSPLPVPLHHVATAATGGILYAVGGLQADNGAIADVFAYDPAADAWTPRAPLPAPRGAAAAVVFDGRVYVAGGLRDGIAVHDFAVYEPTRDAWSTLPPMPHARDHLGLTATDVLVYAMGGRDAGNLLSIGEAFHPPTNQWFKEVAPLLTARGGLAVTGLGGRLYAFGGEGNAASPLGIFPDVEMFDPTRNSWFRQPDMPTPRHGIAAVPAGARIYVVGGAAREGFGPTGATEVFLPASTDALTVRKLALARRGRRLRLVAALEGAPEDPATGQLRVRVREGETDKATVTLGTGALIAKGRGWRPARDALPPGTTLSLRRRGSNMILRLASATLARPAARHGLDVVVELGARIFGGTVR